MVREKLRLTATLALAVGTLASPSPARGAWETVTVVVQESTGETREIEGTKIAYGYYTREFTPKGVKDRLHIAKELPFSDRDVRFPDLTSIVFDLTNDSTTGLLVPTTMHITYLKKREKKVKLERKVSELRGFGNPKPVLLILTTAEGKVEFDLTPPYDDEGRSRYRPIVRVFFH